MKFRVWVLLLNWNNGRDTVECLESIRLCTDPEIAGVVAERMGELEAFFLG